MGSTIALQMENALVYCLKIFGFNEQDIFDFGKQICILSICNLVPLDLKRLFTTISITGVNDKKARKFIKCLPEMMKLMIDNNEIIKYDPLNDKQFSIFAMIPERIKEIGIGIEIIDLNCHYTPLFTAYCENDENIIPKLIWKYILIKY